MTTLTLSIIEQAAVISHLDRHYQRLCAQPPTHPDCVLLHRVMVRVGEGRTLSLNPLEVGAILRALRTQVSMMGHDMLALEERRLRGGVNGTLDAAWRALDTDATTLSDVIRRLWSMS